MKWNVILDLEIKDSPENDDNLENVDDLINIDDLEYEYNLKSEKQNCNIQL